MSSVGSKNMTVPVVSYIFPIEEAGNCTVKKEIRCIKEALRCVRKYSRTRTAYEKQGQGDSAGSEIIVECSFSDHFIIPCATPSYSALHESLPSVFVGTTKQLAPLVEAICGEMIKSFLDSDVTMPPWRTSRAVMSKWAPQRSKDRLPSEATSPRGASLKSSSEYVKPCTPEHESTEWAKKCTTLGEVPEIRRVSSGALQNQSIGSLRQCVNDAIRVQPNFEFQRDAKSQACNVRSSGGSPVFAVKVGFEFPRCPSGALESHVS